MMTAIEGACEFYPFTAEQLPVHEGACVLDLGCGTGLELEHFFRLCPTAKITGIDLSEGMLSALRKKFADRDITLTVGSYFDVDFGKDIYDAAVSAESLHHFTKEEKMPLYAKLCASLKDGGYFILTDYFSQSDEEEKSLREELAALKAAEGIKDGEFYHFDTPLTVAHECEALREAGFGSVEVLKSWGHTSTIKAGKQ